MSASNKGFYGERKQTTCAYCGVGCGLDIELHNGKAVKLQGAESHPANAGRTCVKGTHLLDTLGEQGRLLAPQINEQTVSWNQATEYVAERFAQTIAQYGADSVAFYVSGQLLTEDYYVANKLMKGYIGSANIDTNSRLCMSSAVAGYKRAFGEDVVPCDYRDLEQCDVIFLVGSNAAWTHPVLFQRLQLAKQNNPNLTIVVLDPRVTATSEMADLHLQLEPGSDAGFYNGLLAYIACQGLINNRFVSEHTDDLFAALEKAIAWTPEKVASFCQLPLEQVQQAFQLFTSTDKVVSFYSMGINQSNSGVDKCNAIINCHLATATLGKPGCGPFSITGQPNAMGGREVGGLSNQLTAHLDIDNAEHRSLVQNFWQSPVIADKAGASATHIIDKMLSGKIKAIWIMATNPVVSLPEGDKVIQALQQCDLVVVSDCVDKNDTLAYANVKFPATGWLEKNGTVTNSERCISRQRGMIEAPGQAKHDWQIICDVAKAMNFSGFDYQHPQQIFDEFCRLSGEKNQGQRLFDISAMQCHSIEQYDTLKPQQWPLKTNKIGQLQYHRPFSDGRFSTTNGKARFIAVTPVLPELTAPQAAPRTKAQQDTPSTAQISLLINSGRVRDQWHTMTRTARAHQLNRHTSSPQLSIHPTDAARLNVDDGQFIALTSRAERVVLSAQITSDVKPGQGFMPIHWNRQFASHANAASLYRTVVDPVSAQPQSKQVLAHASKVLVSAQLHIAMTTELAEQFDANRLSFSQRCPQQGFVQFSLYQEQQSDCATELIDSLQDQFKAQLKWLRLMSSADGQQRLIAMHGDQLAIYVDYQTLDNNAVTAPPNSQWLSELFAQNELLNQHKTALLTGQVGDKFVNGEQVCSCFNVYQKHISQAIEQGANTVQELGEKLQCGTGCGSCKPELSRMLASADTNLIAMEKCQ
ncbi:nitrate reductase [Thalassotalea sp. HSM 43]|uniref:nitrate reductase n=1 Tax=Thalassotalea sp. HSM 43 TaxID=2552945 RepID=UPI0010802546|nr:molybdopterin-dependent oxidoreductase [Thalassotalea sp. HSM 43]QBY05639.1 nitrate reductase [Thalassotalea sp. HSM 43]